MFICSKQKEDEKGEGCKKTVEVNYEHSPWSENSASNK
jgi:murein endopeptidase